MSKRPKISAEVSTDEFDAYKKEATRWGYNMSEWMRRTLNSALPRTESTPAVAEAAFQQLEAQDRLDGGVMAQQPIVVQAAVLPLQTLPPTPKPAVVGHPCVFLNPETPGALRGGECFGTCTANTQRGKPCFYGPGNAKKCPLFMMRTVPRAPVNNIRSRK